jgi:hypothetical protein
VLDGGRIGMIIVQEGLLLMLLCPMSNVTSRGRYFAVH